MKTYYLQLGNEIRTETNISTVDTLTRKGWLLIEQPDPNTVWQNGGWVTTPEPFYSPEEWVQQYFSNLEVIALMRLEQGILNQGKTLGPKMTACKQWLEGMMFAQPSSTFPAAPYSYSETSVEAAQTLSSN